jgi:hypothetical protein
MIFPKAWKQFLGLKTLQFFDADPDLGSGIFLTLDPRSATLFSLIPVDIQEKLKMALETYDKVRNLAIS